MMMYLTFFIFPIVICTEISLSSIFNDVLKNVHRDFERSDEGEHINIHENWRNASTVFKGVKIPRKIPENVGISPNFCPKLFQYRYAYEFGGFFGVLTIQKPYKVDKLELEVFMVINRPINTIDNIKIILLSTQEELEASDVINFAIIFPYQDLLPTLTMVKFNQMVLCRVHLKQAKPGIYTSRMWTKLNLFLNGKSQEKSVKVVRNKKNKYSNFMNNFPPLQSPGYGIPPGEYPKGETTQSRSILLSTLLKNFNMYGGKNYIKNVHVKGDGRNMTVFVGIKTNDVHIHNVDEDYDDYFYY